MMSSKCSASKLWASITSLVHKCATECWQLISTCMCANLSEQNAHLSLVYVEPRGCCWYSVMTKMVKLPGCTYYKFIHAANQQKNLT